MRLDINHKGIDYEKTWALVRSAFKLIEADGPEVEVHVKRAEHRRTHWEIGCDGCSFGRNWIHGHTARTRKAVLARCANASRPSDATKVVTPRPAGQLFSGTAYSEPRAAWLIAPGARYLVVLKVPDIGVEGFPYEWSYHRAKTAVTPKIESWEEALVYLSGHEARHTRQYALDLPRSEVDAEASGMVALNAYRRNS